MNDDVEAAEAGLSKGNSAFHKACIVTGLGKWAANDWESLQLGKGVVTFMKAAIGFEQEVMREGGDACRI